MACHGLGLLSAALRILTVNPTTNQLHCTTVPSSQSVNSFALYKGERVVVAQAAFLPTQFFWLLVPARESIIVMMFTLQQLQPHSLILLTVGF
ncbi:hypothetical protein CFIMG_000429RA [Ceratocystis fimbriata CBS 114723]|uniref:Secreted protein n=1 Tax=Ceratocystis fimbriata CBS 114723 TaxID=1035309 RepID=A0A2C5XMR7_9PEZI|nr:hypothetical protein CFIMG_000429RA [Ceratocystis fimbriata CBS 114723]